MLLIGCLGFTLVLLESPSWRAAVLMAVTVWGFCRAYYFAFYVIEHYIDPRFRFAGLTAFFRYVIAHRSPRKKSETDHLSR